PSILLYGSDFDAIGATRHLAQITMGHQFGTNTDGNFRDRLRADVDPQGSMNLGQSLSRHSFSREVLENHLDLSPAADQADVPRPAAGQVKQRFLIMAVAAGDDQAIRVGRNLQIG